MHLIYKSRYLKKTPWVELRFMYICICKLALFFNFIKVQICIMILCVCLRGRIKECIQIYHTLSIVHFIYAPLGRVFN